MKDETKAPGGAAPAGDCDRAEDLVAYLYGEAGPAGEREFRTHLQACAACREEAAALGGVRRSIALWRAEAEAHAPAFGTAVLLTQDDGAARAAGPAGERAGFMPAHGPRGRSARAALREFFTLSPLWLRAGAAAAALVVCGLAALTVARGEVTWDERGFAFRVVAPEAARPAAPSAEPAAAGYTQEQVEAIVAERVARELAAERERLAGENPPQTFAAAGAGESRGARAAAATEAASTAAPKKAAPRVVLASEKAPNPRRTPAQGGNTRRDDAAGVEEESLPSLSDLLGGARD